MTPTVHILASCRNPKLLPSALMVFDTLRVGFPTADVHVYMNVKPNMGAQRHAIIGAALKAGAGVHDFGEGTFVHPEWLEMVFGTAEGPTVLLDTDIIFHKNCEWFNFSGLWAGYYVAKFRCEFANAITMPRLHTSFLWVPDMEQVRARMRVIKDGETFLTPHSLFRPFVYYHDGYRYFQDTTGALYAAIGGQEFKREHLDCYDHLNCGTLIDVVGPRIAHGDKLEKRYAAIKSGEVRGLWDEYAMFYAERRSDD